MLDDLKNARPNETRYFVGVFFHTFVVFQKNVVATVEWQVSSKEGFGKDDSNLQLLALAADVQKAKTDFKSNPMNSAEIDAIKNGYPRQTVVDF